MSAECSNPYCMTFLVLYWQKTLPIQHQKVMDLAKKLFFTKKTPFVAELLTMAVNLCKIS